MASEHASVCGISVSLVEKLGQRVCYGQIAEVVIRKLGKDGLRINSRQRAKLARWIEQGANGPSPLPHAQHILDDGTLVLTPRDQRRIKGRVGAEVRAIVADATWTAAERLALPAWKKTEKELLRTVRREARSLHGFEQRLWRTWKRPLELLQIQRHMALTLGAEINDELRRSSKREDHLLIKVLTSQHARACQIAGEVIVLLQAGYPDGAMARWRSLHEASVVLQFVDAYGAETARRYVEHEAIESWKGAQEYAAHCGRLGFKGIDAEEMRRIKAAHDAAVEKYGPAFKSAYGWAAQALGAKKDRISFDEVEKGLGLEHWRPFYRFASHSIHANPKSVGCRLALIDGVNVRLPAGPSNYGLADPGQNTGLTLAQATSVLIVRAPTPDRVLAMAIMGELSAKIAKAFIAVQRRIERSETVRIAHESLAVHKEKTP